MGTDSLYSRDQRLSDRICARKDLYRSDKESLCARTQLLFLPGRIGLLSHRLIAGSAGGAEIINFPFYVIGFLLLFGSLFRKDLYGGWLCPFGLVQDLLLQDPICEENEKLAGTQCP